MLVLSFLWWFSIFLQQRQNILQWEISEKVVIFTKSCTHTHTRNCMLLKQHQIEILHSAFFKILILRNEDGDSKYRTFQGTFSENLNPCLLNSWHHSGVLLCIECSTHGGEIVRVRTSDLHVEMICEHEYTWQTRWRSISSKGEHICQGKPFRLWIIKLGMRACRMSWRLLEE